jgi:MFS family permease
MKGKFEALNLLGTRRFAAFFWTQALGAFNDNLIKNLLVLLVTYDNARFGSPNAGSVSSLASAIFTLPFILFAGLSGQLADRYPKRSILRAVKLFEVFIMGIAIFGLVQSDLNLLLLALFLMGVHSTFFSPAKYGVLPELLSIDELAIGNGLLEAGTFLAILLGTLIAIALYSLHSTLLLGSSLLCVAFLGLFSSAWIPKTPYHQPELKIDFNPWTSIRDNFSLTYKHSSVWCGALGISWFWAIGIVILAQIPIFVHEVLRADESVVSTLLGGFTAGIGIGSLVGALWRSDRLSDQVSRIGLLGLSVGLMSFVFFSSMRSSLEHLVVWLSFSVVTIGFTGGLFVVPLYTCLNTESPPEYRSRIVSANSVLNFLFMIVASLGTSALLQRGITVGQLFMLLTVFNICFTPWYFRYQRRIWSAQRLSLGIAV